MARMYKVEACKGCPNLEITRTIKAGYAFDWHCKVMNKKIAGYIEYKSEEPTEIPGWCPLPKEKENNNE